LSTFNVGVIAGSGSQMVGNICFPDRGDAVTEDSIIVIPHGGEDYHVPGMICKAIITEIGNRMCHLAIVTREQKKTMIKFPNAMEVLKDVGQVFIKCDDAGSRGTVTEVMSKE